MLPCLRADEGGAAGAEGLGVPRVAQRGADEKVEAFGEPALVVVEVLTIPKKGKGPVSRAEAGGSGQAGGGGRRRGEAGALRRGGVATHLDAALEDGKRNAARARNLLGRHTIAVLPW